LDERVDWEDQSRLKPVRELEPGEEWGPGPLPEEPVPVWGWGSIPDQYGRRSAGELELGE